MRIAIFALFLLIGCSQFAENEDRDDAKFYAFQQECLAKIEKINKTNSNYRKSGWMKSLFSEGSEYFAPNWSFFKERYGEQLSQSYNYWLNHLDETEQIAEDAGLIIDHDKLRIYIIELENFIDKNPNFVAIKEVKSRLNWYVNAYLTGLDNTPLYDRYDRFLRPEVRVSFERFLSLNYTSKYYPLVLKVYEKFRKNKFKRIP